MSVAMALQTLATNLELTSAQKATASAQHTTVREHLKKGLTLDDNFLSGSYARHTAVRPLNDIDLFAVLRARSSVGIIWGPVYSSRCARTD
jgi:tRNA nucleotidyltransferase (CCA-adding enzyme)